MTEVFDKWVDFVGKKHFSIHLILVILALAVGIVLYFEEGNSTQTALADQMLHREQVVTRSGSISLSTFVQDLSNQVSAYSTWPYIESFDKDNVQDDVNILLHSWENTPVSGILLIDKNGVVRYGADRNRVVGIGADLSKVAYYTWAKTAIPGDRFVGSPIVSKIGFTTGRYIVPVAAPVFKDGKFNGVLVITFLVDDATTKFLDPLKISDNTLVFVLDHDGNFVFSPIPNLIGTNFTNLFNDRSFPGKDGVIAGFKGEFAKPDTQGKFDITIPNLMYGNTLTRFLMTYSVANLGPGNDWSLIVMTPASDAFLFTGPFYTDQIFTLIYLIIVVIGFSLVGITTGRIKEIKVNQKEFENDRKQEN